MTNKIIVVILVFLVILSGGLGYHSYTLSQQINYLGEQLTSFQINQTAQIDAINSELASFREQFLAKTSDLENKIDENLVKIDSLEDKIDENIARISDLKSEIGRTADEIDNLKSEIIQAAKATQSVIDASQVFQRASQATVRISNGETTVGSGFIFDNEAHVLTAHHVVDKLSEIYVILPDGRVSTAINVTSCLYSDVSVLTLEETPAVEPLIMADSAHVRVGEPVAAIGNPFELRETLTTGIVSQTDRFADIQYNSQTRWVANLIQFDAAVNFGNSGCPLVNSEGEVIGMVIARIGPDEGDGIYYAVSSNKVKRVADSLIEHGSFDYPWLGVEITNITPKIVQTKTLETTNGVWVEEVLLYSPAGSAGIKADDVIVAIDGVPIRDVAALTSYLGEHKSPGEAATITLVRDATEIEVSLTIGKRP